MSDGERDDAPSFGTVAMDAPVTRAELERALRALNVADLELRDAILQMGARMVALTDELTRRLDGVEPEPAPPGTPAPEPTATLEAAVMQQIPGALVQVRAADAQRGWRLQIDLGPSKYEVEPSSPPCDELLPICKARCCTFDFALSSADLDEGVIRWDHGQPYLIRQRASDGYCVHNDPAGHGCSVHAYRPRVCRVYDCRTDARVWADFDQRILAPLPEAGRAATAVNASEAPQDELQVIERLKARIAAIKAESAAVNNGFADTDPVVGPPAKPRRR